MTAEARKQLTAEWLEQPKVQEILRTEKGMLAVDQLLDLAQEEAVAVGVALAEAAVMVVLTGTGKADTPATPTTTTTAEATNPPTTDTEA